jgi:SAM-dependent methyltransferase
LLIRAHTGPISYPRLSTLFYAATIFLSAFLLFEVQPVIAKMILPWFGGTSAVWSTCMLFFQVVLLLGYLYAHFLNRKLTPRRQAIFHIAILVLSAAALPILPNPHWKTSAIAQPSLRILALLATTVGLPYFLLSSTSPLLQAWYARTHKQGLPYRLFALSNFASLLALLSYPLLIEPNLPSRLQGTTWSAAYVVFAALCGWTAWRASSSATVSAEPVDRAPAAAPTWLVRSLWLALSASASILLLAVTTHLTQDVAPIPFLWILPLTAYLLTFIICFEAPRLYWRPIFLPLFAAAMGFMAFLLWPEARFVQAPLLHFVGSMTGLRTIGAFLAALFIACMACHGELARLKPDPRYLTGFYVTVSLGGALGGLFVGLVAPNFFRAFYEFPIGLAVCAITVAAVLTLDLWSRESPPSYAAAVSLAAIVLLYCWGVSVDLRETVAGYRIVARNFYGLLRVYDDGGQFDEFASRKLVHGVINHGEQMLNDPYRRQPVTYFCADSGVGRAMLALEGHPRRIGVLGLGCGTLAAYGRPGDTLRIYEINPLVLALARSEFTYLSDTPARVETALGDARLTLEAEPPQHFDILVMDAFSGDSVPVHLITREAFQQYFRHLKPDGVLAVNITNRYLDLEPVMERAAAAFGKIAVVYRLQPASSDELCFASNWALILDRSTLDAHPSLRKFAVELKPSRPFRIWTDDFSNMYGILK